MRTGSAAELPTACDANRAAQQLAVMRTTYPGWEIHRALDGPEQVTWTATLRRDTAARERAAGVEPHLERPDAPSLASALAHQVALIHNQRGFTWPP